MRLLSSRLNRFTSDGSLSVIWFSPDGMGNVIRSLGTSADYVCLSGNTLFVMCGTRSSSDIGLLVVDAFTLHASSRISKYRGPRHVSPFGTLVHTLIYE